MIPIEDLPDVTLAIEDTDEDDEGDEYAPLFPCYSPLATKVPCSNYGGFLTTGDSYCTMYTLCSVL